MKKLFFILLTLILISPTVTYAGSATSRYDVTIGGYVKFDFGYATQNTNSDAATAYRESTVKRLSINDEYRNTFLTVGESHLNVLIKGPDAFGAKTTAFVDGDFRGVTTGNAYGGFELYQAFMKLNWDNTEVIIGHNWQQFGMIYDRGAIGQADFTTSLKGLRFPQFTVRHNLTKQFNVMLGVFTPTEWSGTTRQFNDDYARSGMPYFQYELAYQNEKYGKVGVHGLKFAVGGYYGVERKTNTTYYRGLAYKDDTVPSWITAARFFIPIIPEKQGNKKNAFAFNGNLFLGENVAGLNWLGGTNSKLTDIPSAGSYWRPNNRDAAAPTVFGGFGQLTYYLAGNLRANAMYGYMKNNYSVYQRLKNPDPLNMNQEYAFSLLYDVSPNLLVGAQWSRIFTRWNGASNTTGSTSNIGTSTAKLSKDGTLDQYRVAAWYFF